MVDYLFIQSASSGVSSRESPTRESFEGYLTLQFVMSISVRNPCFIMVNHAIPPRVILAFLLPIATKSDSDQSLRQHYHKLGFPLLHPTCFLLSWKENSFSSFPL
jgi:hypothetical protein